MAIRSFVAASLRSSCQLQFVARNFMSSRALPIGDVVNTLTTEILRLKKYPSGSATAVVRNWTDSGHKLTTSHLRDLANHLIKSRRYHYALQILEWMGTKKNLRVSPVDCATRVKLIIKVYGLKEAEEYFRCGDIQNSASQKAAFQPLLQGYVKARDISKAEALMKHLNGLGLIVSPQPYNEMMKLYNATSRYEYVPLVILEMKRNQIPRNVLSYNLWMNAFGEIGEVANAERVYKEMVADENVEIGWSSLVTLANVYVKGGFDEKALLVIECAEKKLSVNGRLGYSFVMTMYSSVKNKEGVLRAWEASKLACGNGRMTCANYMCVLSCLVKVGDVENAERVFREWEDNCWKYDIRVSNVLLGAYVRTGRMDKAELLHLRTLKRGGCPNYKTWEILMEGWLRSQNMEKAVEAMKKGFSKLRTCHWKPSHGILMTIAEYFDKKGNFEDVNHYVRAIHQLGIASLPLYKIFLRMYLCARKPAFHIIKMMEKDKIKMDDETSTLVRALHSYL